MFQNPTISFLYKNIVNEGDEIIAYMYPREEQSESIAGLKGVLHMADALTSKLASGTQVSEVTFLSSGSTQGELHQEQQHYTASFRILTHYIFVFVLPNLSDRGAGITYRSGKVVIRALLTLLSTLFGDFDSCTNLEAMKDTLDQFFRQMLTRLRCQSCEYPMEGISWYNSLVGLPSLLLPVLLKEQVNQLLGKLEMACNFPITQQSLGSGEKKIFLVAGTTVHWRGFLLGSRLPLNEQETITRWLWFEGDLTPHLSSPQSQFRVHWIYIREYELSEDQHLFFSTPPAPALTKLNARKASVKSAGAKPPELCLLLSAIQGNLVLTVLLKPVRGGSELGVNSMKSSIELYGFMQDFLGSFTEKLEPYVIEHSHRISKVPVSLSDSVYHHTNVNLRNSGTQQPPIIHFVIHVPTTCNVFYPLQSITQTNSNPAIAKLLSHIRQNFMHFVEHWQNLLQYDPADKTVIQPVSESAFESEIFEVGSHFAVIDEHTGEKHCGYWLFALSVKDTLTCFLCCEDSLKVSPKQLMTTLALNAA